jgi:hypothetical protein
MIDLKKVATTVGIAVLLAFFVYFTIDAIYPEPKYEDYCKQQYGGPYPERPMVFKEGMGYVPQYNCTPIAGLRKLEQECGQKGGFLEYEYDDLGCETKAKCNTCSKEFDERRKRYTLNVFYITAPIGIAAIVLGMYLPLMVEAIAAGILFGGIATLFQSTVRVFGDLGKWARVIVLFIELCIMIWVALKKVSDWKPTQKASKRKK